MREKRFGSKLNARSFTLDFAGRQVLDVQANTDPRQYHTEIEEILAEKTNNAQSNTVVNKDIAADINPKFVETGGGTKTKQKKILINKENERFRIQDSDLQEMKDDGMCLSMHQPWASLLVTGIKM